MAAFFSRLSYSFGNEDWITEQKALQIQPQDRVLCITASGDRPLNLLMSDCQNIVCVDANKIQNYLLSLKCTAMQEFDYDQYLSFLGVTPNNYRRELLRKIIPKMDAEAGKFWLKHEKMVAKGILYQGAVERLVKKAALLISLFRKAKVKRLFEISNLEEQKIFIREQWDCSPWRKTFEWALNPLVSKILIRDPGLYTNQNGSIKPSHYIYDRMTSSLNRCLARENPLISLILKGEVQKEAYPPYLTSQGVEVIRARLDRLSICTSDIVHYLESISEPTFDCFSLSDVASYIGKEDFVHMLNGIYKAAKPHARFSIRQFLSFHEIPPSLQRYFVRDLALENRLEKEDRCFVYRFMVGTIVK